MTYLSLFIYFYLGCLLFVHPIFSSVSLILLVIYELKKKNYKSLKKYSIFFVLGIGIYLLNTTKSHYQSIGIVVESKNNYFIFQSLSGRYYVNIEDNTYQVFDIIKVEGKVKEYAFNFYESQFDFNKYLKDKLVEFEVEPTRIKGLFLPFFRVNMMIKKSLSPYDEVSKAFIGKLLFNFSFDSSYSTLISEQGLGYYLSISSFHLYFLLSIIRKLLRIKLQDKPCDFILIILSSLFMIFTSFKISVVRLFIYSIIYYLNEYRLKEKISSTSKIGLTYLIIGILSPASLLSTSFIYSFPLLIFLDSISQVVYYNSKNAKLTYIFLINIFFIPFNLYFNGYFNVFSIVLGVLLMPFILTIYLLSLISLILPINIVVSFFIKGIVNLITYFEYINIKFYIPTFNIVFIIVYYLFLIVYLYYFKTKRRKKMKLVLSIFFLFLSIGTLPINTLYERRVSIINVGQGDSILISDRSKHYLIDTGGNLYNDLALNSLIPFFRKNGINKIDKVFITHFDFDHYGALESLQANFKVKEVITQDNFEPISYTNFEMINLNNYQDLWEEKNDSSLVLYLKFKDYKFLFMGDASTKVEKRIVKDYPNMKVDILKAGHHGSNTSSCEEFISCYKPKEAVLSCGKKNKYHHPHKETIEVLNKYHIKIRNTSKEGTITYKVY